MKVASREEWRTARAKLLEAEKAVTRGRDAVNAQRRELPMVRVEKDYRFEGADGGRTLAELFDGRTQLITYHFMFGEDWAEGCSSCSLLADNIGHPAHLHASDTTLVMVSRAPREKIELFQKRMGWEIPWFSSYGTDFNDDYEVTVNGQERHGLSVFFREGDDVFHTYSTYDRGPELLLGTYNYLDLTPLGRQRYVNEFPHHDKY
jgi:predicted dithiol-disulfide oxidoreductase (DUF899 family)